MESEFVSCTLPVDELMTRLTAWCGVASHALTREFAGNKIVSTYPRDPALLRELWRLIAAEADCCAFMKFIVEEREDDVLVELSVPPDMTGSLTAMFALLGQHQNVSSPELAPPR